LAGRQTAVATAERDLGGEETRQPVRKLDAVEPKQFQSTSGEGGGKVYGNAKYTAMKKDVHIKIGKKQTSPERWSWKMWNVKGGGSRCGDQKGQGRILRQSQIAKRGNRICFQKRREKQNGPTTGRYGFRVSEN